MYQGAVIIKENLKLFKYFFKYVHDIEERIIDILSNSQLFKNASNPTLAKLSVAYKISGLVGIAKIYLNEIEKNSTLQISLNDFVDLLVETSNTKNPYLQ